MVKYSYKKNNTKYVKKNNTNHVKKSIKKQNGGTTITKPEVEFNFSDIYNFMFDVYLKIKLDKSFNKTHYKSFAKKNKGKKNLFRGIITKEELEKYISNFDRIFIKEPSSNSTTSTELVKK